MTAHTPLSSGSPFIPAPPSSAPSSLPAIIDALPANSAHAPQTQFTRARQASFLRRLADCGEVRVAARASNVAHQTAYRMRRACRVFARGWDAALLVARERAEDLLATRAMHGVEEQVFYHGEVVATRRRHDSRLLLAHLARLDRKAECEDLVELAGAFDDVIAAFETAAEGEEPELTHKEQAPAQAGACVGSEKTPPEPCNMRSMSGSEADDVAASTVSPCPDCGGTCDDPDAKLTSEDCQWLGNRFERMEAARPAGKLKPHQLTQSVDEIDELEWAQLMAFEAGEESWWEALPERDARSAAGVL